MPAKIAWIMIGNPLPILTGDLKPSFFNKLGQILGYMNHLKVHHEFRILIFKGMVTMGGRNEDLLHAVINKVLDVFLRQTLK